VKGFTATQSGLMLAPNAAGLSLAAIVTGRLTTRNGRYKHWLLVGTGVVIVVLLALSQIDAGWGTWHIALTMLAIGLGLGMAMPVLSTASQNAVEFSDLGVVTAAVTFFRTLGGSIGIAALAAVLKGQFDSLLRGVAEKTPLPPGATAKSLADHPDDIHKLLEPLRHLVEVALSHAIATTFLAAVPMGVVAFVLSWFLKELPLRESTTLNAGAGAETSSEAEQAAPIPVFE